MRNVLAAAALASAVCGAAARAQTADPGAPDRSAPAAGAERAAGLSDLDAVTLDCAKAGLNAAAREAAKAPSQGSYQFAYFKAVNETHHASFEVHFKSNHHGEADLKYCVSVYCQQGWSQATTSAAVRRISDGRQARAGAAHAAACGHMPTPPRRRPER